MIYTNVKHQICFDCLFGQTKCSSLNLITPRLAQKPKRNSETKLTPLVAGLQVMSGGFEGHSGEFTAGAT